MRSQPPQGHHLPGARQRTRDGARPSGALCAGTAPRDARCAVSHRPRQPRGGSLNLRPRRPLLTEPRAGALCPWDEDAGRGSLAARSCPGSGGAGRCLPCPARDLSRGADHRATATAEKNQGAALFHPAVRLPRRRPAGRSLYRTNCGAPDQDALRRKTPDVPCRLGDQT